MPVLEVDILFHGVLEILEGNHNGRYVVEGLGLNAFVQDLVNHEPASLVVRYVSLSLDFEQVEVPPDDVIANVIAMRSLPSSVDD